jgi:acyl-homoserine lactone acylase PvdQ
MEMLQRVVRGTLSELLGPAGLAVDRLSRRIGFRHAALQQLAVLDADVRTHIEAYARGATDGASRGLPRRPHEFVLLRTRPTPWEAADTLGVVKLVSFTLASNWDVELARLKVLTTDGPEALAALDPAYPEWHPVTAPVGQAAGPAVDRLAQDLAAFAEVVRIGAGRTTGRSPVRAPPPAGPWSPTTRISTRDCLRTGICCTCARRSGPPPGPVSLAGRASRRGTTATRPGALPPG